MKNDVEIISKSAEFIWTCVNMDEAQKQLVYVRDVLGYKDAYIYRDNSCDVPQESRQNEFDKILTTIQEASEKYKTVWVSFPYDKNAYCRSNLVIFYDTDRAKTTFQKIVCLMSFDLKRVKEIRPYPEHDYVEINLGY